MAGVPRVPNLLEIKEGRLRGLARSIRRIGPFPEWAIRPKGRRNVRASLQGGLLSSADQPQSIHPNYQWSGGWTWKTSFMPTPSEALHQACSGACDKTDSEPERLSRLGTTANPFHFKGCDPFPTSPVSGAQFAVFVDALLHRLTFNGIEQSGFRRQVRAIALLPDRTPVSPSIPPRGKPQKWLGVGGEVRPPTMLTTFAKEPAATP
jgi:hypothetical protein